MSRPILLDSYAARSCPVKTQHAYDATAARSLEPAEADDKRLELFDGGRAFRAVVLDALIERCQGRVVDLRLLAAAGPAAHTDLTVRAMASGADVVMGGQLPVDRDGHRVGGPDLLIRGADTSQGRPGYHPVEVKWHKIIERARPGGSGVAPATLTCSTLAEPSPVTAWSVPDQRLRIASRERGFLPLAHCYRMLQACGFAGERPLGAIIGTDGLFDAPVLAWADLAEPMVRTFSRQEPEGWRLRSLLQRYDHEQAFRVAVADVAAQRSGRPDDPALLVRPIVTGECARCQWWEQCRPRLHPEDVSLRIDRAPLDPREIATLRRLDVEILPDLAGADLEELLPAYLPEVTHRPGAETRLRLAARRAQLLLAGTAFVRESEGPIAVPAADLEIDFDIETSVDGRVYLWGFLVQHVGDPGDAAYYEFSRFADLDDAGEAALAVAAFSWLQTVVDATPRVRIYHYSGYEVSTLQALATRETDPVLQWATAYAEEHFVDLLEIVKAHFFGVAGLGLKAIAQHAGFAWRDDDPGGLNSQAWFAEAVHADNSGVRAGARQRVLEYNEDDVRATRQLRTWLRSR